MCLVLMSHDTTHIAMATCMCCMEKDLILSRGWREEEARGRREEGKGGRGRREGKEGGRRRGKEEKEVQSSGSRMKTRKLERK